MSHGGTTLYVIARDETYINRPAAPPTSPLVMKWLPQFAHIIQNLTIEVDLSKFGTQNWAAFAKYGLNKRKETQLLATVVEVWTYQRGFDTPPRYTDWANDTDPGDFKLDPRGLGPPLCQSASFSVGERVMSEKMVPRIGENQLISPKRYSDEGKELKTVATTAANNSKEECVRQQEDNTNL